MNKTVYLTTRCFDSSAREFRNALAKELSARGIDVVVNSTCPITQFFAKHHTYGIAIAIDFFRDDRDGCGLTLNKKCTYISRDFAYNLSNALDIHTPTIRWRNFKFVDSDNPEWYRFFNKVSASTKAILYLCTKNNDDDFTSYKLAFEKLVKSFAEEIVRCLRSNYDYVRYKQSSHLAKLKARRAKYHGVDKR